MANGLNHGLWRVLLSRFSAMKQEPISCRLGRCNMKRCSEAVFPFQNWGCLPSSNQTWQWNMHYGRFSHRFCSIYQRDVPCLMTPKGRPCWDSPAAGSEFPFHSTEVWLYLLAHDLLQLSSSSRSLRLLGLQLLPRRLKKLPFALLSRDEKTEVFRFLPVMEVGMGDFGGFRRGPGSD